jgi:hypothetical protein
MPILPKSAGELDGYQISVINVIALASGRHQRRIAWIEATTRALHPSELGHVPRKRRSLDYKISAAALESSKRITALCGILRRERDRVCGAFIHSSPCREWRMMD